MRQPTVAVLYPGEMGAALARVLRSGGVRVISTLADRSSRTAASSREAGVEEVGSWDELAKQADVVVSVVPPTAAQEVARRYCEVAHLAPATAVYIDLNSIGPDLAFHLADRLSAAGVCFVDGSIHGQARAVAAASGAVLYLSGGRAAEVGPLFAAALPVEVLGEAPGIASLMKMLLGGLSKGICALFLETALLAERSTLPAFLEEAGRFYPEVVAAVRRMLPTYPDHVGRRADEMWQLERTARTAGQRPQLFRTLPLLLEELRRMPFETAPEGGWTVESLPRHLVAHGFLDGASSTEVAPTALTRERK